MCLLHWPSRDLPIVPQSVLGAVLWAVVANAGIFEFKEFEWFTPAEISRTLDINVLGVSRTAQTFLPLLREGRGRLLIVSSYAGKIRMFMELQLVQPSQAHIFPFVFVKNVPADSLEYLSHYVNIMLLIIINEY